MSQTESLNDVVNSLSAISDIYTRNKAQHQIKQNASSQGIVNVELQLSNLILRSG